MPKQDDDPFAFLPDPNRTVILPSPGGRRRGGAAAVIPPASAGEATTPFDDIARSRPQDLAAAHLASANPLVHAAGPLFTLVRQLRSLRDHADVATLRADIIEAMQRFQTELITAGVDQRTVAQASYALCALIDETILGTPWGLQSIWSKQSLLITFYGEATAGEKFFNFLDRARESPRNHIDIIEFFYICLSLGFQGKFRVEAGGVDRLTRLRQDLYAVIARERGVPERQLSLRWRGVEDKSPGVARFLPLWVVGAAAFAVVVLVFLAYTFSLNALSDRVYGRVAALVPFAGRTSPAAPVTQPAPTPAMLDRLRVTLAPEIARRLVEVQVAGGRVRIIVFNRGLFASGGAEVGPEAVPLIRKIALFLADQTGPFEVIGHTDNVPIRTLRFPSNWHLSKARADAVAAGMVPPLDASRLHVEGRADTEPLETNDTSEGRSQNRRVEIRLPLS
ncbi:MAG: type IVB secretion system protein IcmH/DotU [Rhodospirillales bacterium]